MYSIVQNGDYRNLKITLYCYSYDMGRQQSDYVLQSEQRLLYRLQVQCL